MAGGGGSRYSGPSSSSLQQKLEKIRQQEQARLEKNITSYLQELLAKYNNRNVEEIEKRLDKLQKLLGKETEVDKILLGGSVAKHTAIDGLSDVDALVILDKQDIVGKTPEKMLDTFYKTIYDKLTRANVKSIRKGKLAVTVIYRDGTEIQLLPAVKTGDKISIASANGKNWNDTKPIAFQKKLSGANKQLNLSLVPAIKLVKSIVSTLPKQKQLSGYHIEALAIDAVKGYKNVKTPKALVSYLLNHASERVLRPMQDSTGQARTVDAYLGKANSIERRNVAQTLQGICRRLNAATSVAEWRSILGDDK